MSLKKDLTNLLGSNAVFDDEETLRHYSRDQSFVPQCMPDAVAFPESVEQIQAIVAYANQTAVPLVPYSSGLNMHGGTVPKEGGVILNMSRMNRIIEVDQDNWFAVVEPGVTIRQLQNALEEKGLRAMLPLGTPPARSALTSCVERDPALASASFEYGNDLLMDTEIVLPDGELFKTGLWSAGGRPGSHMGPVRSMLYRFWTAAQGTLGILTKACIKVEHLPGMMEIRAFRFNSFNESLAALIDIQRREIGLECFLLNKLNLAALYCDDWHVPEEFPASPVASQDFSTLLDALPCWTLFVCLHGAPELPEEKIAYQAETLDEIAGHHGLNSVPLNGKQELLQHELLRPWGVLKKYNFKGAVHDLSFKAPLKRIPEFQHIIARVAEKYAYPIEEIGGYILPVERGRGAHCEFDFHAGPDGAAGHERIHALWREAGELLVDEGAFFDRPYGDWADMMYSRTGEYTAKLRELKIELDPNNILNPGHLCF